MGLLYSFTLCCAVSFYYDVYCLMTQTPNFNPLCVPTE